jgi:hypothetical protein
MVTNLVGASHGKKSSRGIVREEEEEEENVRSVKLA